VRRLTCDIHSDNLFRSPVPHSSEEIKGNYAVYCAGSLGGGFCRCRLAAAWDNRIRTTVRWPRRPRRITNSGAGTPREGVLSPTSTRPCLPVLTEYGLIRASSLD
jgi:hypothetical protein